MRSRMPIRRILYDRLLPILYPNRCPVCRKLVPYGRQICEDCRGLLPMVTDPVCFRCGKPVSSSEQEMCYDCRVFPKSFQRGWALFLYNKVIRPAMADLKYHNRRTLSGFFAAEAVRRHGEELAASHIQAIIPVPIHKNKRKKRGYNQAALLARDLAPQLSLPCFPELLIRTIDTLPQKNFNPQARLNNIQNAFSLNPACSGVARSLHTVLLIDDIYTTGATMEACTRVLHASGIKNVCIYSICIGVSRD